MARIIIIPARLAATRFPAKLLQDQTGWPLIRHGYEQCRRVPGVSHVVVAADGPKIAAAVTGFGGVAVETDPELPSGTDRVAAAARELGLDPATDFIVNVQGDEPEIDPSHLELLFRLLEESGADVATLASPRNDTDGFLNPNRVKVARAESGDALYFSRTPIPYCGADTAAGSDWLLHVGTYGFRPGALAKIAQHPPTELEKRERLEQLRFLEMGLRIQVGIVDSAAAGIDTPEDYEEFVQRHARGDCGGN
ncbi:MAG: 3-deoxy-manno-octulosonate cytidylyltransferase [Planctomycetota bacterium]